MNGITQSKIDSVLGRIARDMAGVDVDSNSLAIANRRLLIARLVAKTIPRSSISYRLEIRHPARVAGGES